MEEINSLRDWKELFISTIISGGEREDFMDRFRSFFDEYNEKGLINNSEKETKYFENEICSDITSAFMRVGRLAEGALFEILISIEDVLSLFVNAYSNGKELFSKYILELYRYNAIFFEKNDIRVEYNSTVRTNSLFTQFVSFIFESELIEQIEQYVKSNPTFHNIDFIVNLVESFRNCAEQEQLEEFYNQTTEPFIQFLNDFSQTKNIRDVDNIKLLHLLTNSYKWKNAVKSTLVCAGSLLKCDFLDKQIIGAKVIFSFAERKDTADEFFAWSKDYNLVSILNKTEIHQELLNVLASIFGYYFQKYPISVFLH